MDTILFGGTIRREATALAVRHGRIVRVGGDRDVLALRTPNTNVIDLGGRRVLPGFCDSHMHMLLTGVVHARLDLRGVRSPEEIVARGRAYCAERQPPPGAWIVGYGFDHNRFPHPVLPDRRVAEAISTAHPVLLDRVCGHVGAANGAALALAGYHEGTVLPGGALDRDETGRLNGILRETALDRIKTFLPKLDRAAVTAHLEEMGKRFAAAGLTAVHSDDLGPEGTDWDTLRAAVDDLKARGALRVRIFEEWELPTAEAVKSALARGARSGWGDDDLQLCNCKLITDGSLGARTAFLREDYSDDGGNRGIPVYTQEQLDELTALCHGGNLQVAFHAIGDGALAQCITAVERAMEKDPKPLRHRIVHGQIGDRALYARMAALGMGADIQPAFTATDHALVRPRLGPRAAESYAWRTLLRAGVTLGGGSDAPVEDYRPLWGIQCAVTRRDRDGGPPFLPEECLTVPEAVALYTQGGAVLAGREGGALRAGLPADLVVPERDIFAIPPEEIGEAGVFLTMMDGHITHRAP